MTWKQRRAKASRSHGRSDYTTPWGTDPEPWHRPREGPGRGEGEGGVPSGLQAGAVWDRGGPIVQESGCAIRGDLRVLSRGKPRDRGARSMKACRTGLCPTLCDHVAVEGPQCGHCPRTPQNLPRACPQRTGGGRLWPRQNHGKKGDLGTQGPMPNLARRVAGRLALSASGHCDSQIH